jgi:hypothetical protein
MLWNAQPSVAPMGLVAAGAVGERVDAACGAGMRAGVRARLGRWTLLRVRDHAPVFQPSLLVRAVPCVQRACALAPVGKGGRAETAGACACRHSDRRVRAATTRRAADAATRTAVYSPRHRHQMGTSPPRASCSPPNPRRQRAGKLPVAGAHIPSLDCCYQQDAIHRNRRRLCEIVRVLR